MQFRLPRDDGALLLPLSGPQKESQTDVDTSWKLAHHFQIALQ